MWPLSETSVSMLYSMSPTCHLTHSRNARLIWTCYRSLLLIRNSGKLVVTAIWL
ncbi:hypothetical protein CsSME_00041741 [Camellia sinensis var. sinensis]